MPGIFDIDANGILNVSAKDKATGKEQAIRIEASSGLSKEEIDRMKAEAEQNAASDKAEREKIDKLNQADSMIFTTENFLKDNGDKIPARRLPSSNIARIAELLATIFFILSAIILLLLSHYKSFICKS